MNIESITPLSPNDEEGKIIGEIREEKLLSCPFCGCEKINIEEQDPTKQMSTYVWAECAKCHVQTDCDDEEKIIAFWNTRAVTSLTAENERLKTALSNLNTQLDFMAETLKDWMKNNPGNSYFERSLGQFDAVRKIKEMVKDFAERS